MIPYLHTWRFRIAWKRSGFVWVSTVSENKTIHGVAKAYSAPLSSKYTLGTRNLNEKKNTEKFQWLYVHGEWSGMSWDLSVAAPCPRPTYLQPPVGL
jgi:hypothetical protein